MFLGLYSFTWRIYRSFRCVASALCYDNTIVDANWQVVFSPQAAFSKSPETLTNRRIPDLSRIANRRFATLNLLATTPPQIRHRSDTVGFQSHSSALPPGAHPAPPVVPPQAPASGLRLWKPLLLKSLALLTEQQFDGGRGAMQLPAELLAIKNTVLNLCRF